MTGPGVKSGNRAKANTHFDVDASQVGKDIFAPNQTLPFIGGRV